MRTPTVLNLLWIKSSKPSLLNCMFQINNNGLASSPVQNWLLFHSVVDKKSLSIKEQTLKKRDLFMLLWRIHRFLIRPWWMQQKWYLQKIPTWIHKCFLRFHICKLFCKCICNSVSSRMLFKLGWFISFWCLKLSYGSNHDGHCPNHWWKHQDTLCIQ